MQFNLKGNYFNGSFELPIMEGHNAVERFITRHSPCNLEQLLWKLPIEFRHIDSVIESATNSFTTWKRMDLSKRIEFLQRYKDEVKKQRDQIANAISLEMGKPLWEAYTEADALASKVDVTINDSLPRIESKFYDSIMAQTHGHIHYKPIGPCLIIGPFNFPCHLANTQILSSLIAGNTVIFKPSEKTAYSAQLMIDCFHNAGFPGGVVNMIQGDGELASRLVREKNIKGIFFTGSKEIGMSILKNTSHDLSKLVSLELGGKNASIVHNDVNLNHVLAELIKGSFLTSGQRCTSTSLVAVHKSIADELITKFHEISKKIIVDHPIDFENEPFMGPLVDEKSVDNYLNFMGMAKREGLTEIMRGKKLDKKYLGHYVSPSIHFSEKKLMNSHFLLSEIFGPNATFIPYDNIEDAIDIANMTEYGLAASVFTNDRSIYRDCVENIDAGLVNLNRSTCGASAKLPFGGVKNSGNYRPAAVTTIDSCVYQMASLEITQEDPNGLSGIKGINI